MRRAWRSAAAVLAVLGQMALAPGTASALMVWTLVGSPLIVTANQTTTFTLTATNLDLLTDLGCLEVDLPPSFVIVSTGSPNASNGDAWSSDVSGQAVLVYSQSGGGRLELSESVTFTIRARPTAAGAFTWPNHAHRQQDCSGTDQPGAALAITVLPGPTPTPSPSPTAVPTLSPSPTPAPPTPSPTLPLPSLPLPSAPLPSLPLPIDPLPTLPVPTLVPTPSGESTRSPGASASPTASSDASRPAGESASPEPDRSPGTDGAGAGGSGGSSLGPSGSSGTDAGGGLRLAPESPRALNELGVGFGIVDLLADAHLWFVPATAIGVPGLLLIVWVALQAAGVLAWIPAVRRMRGDDGEQHRRVRRSRGT